MAIKGVSQQVLDKLSEQDVQTIESILLVVDDAKHLTDDCETACDLAAEIGHQGCKAVKNPVARAACHLAIDVAKGVCKESC